VTYPEALGLTIAVEAPVYTVLLRLLAGAPWGRALLASVLVNLISHPLFTFVLLPWLDRAIRPVPALLVAEAMVVVIEAALIYAWLRRRLAAVVGTALAANWCSLVLGLLLG